MFLWRSLRSFVARGMKSTVVDQLGCTQESDESVVRVGFIVHGPIVRRVRAEASGELEVLTVTLSDVSFRS
jgi:hypothetical protein